jgi:homospermidine synthase
MTNLPGRVLVIGLGSVSRCTLPLLFKHIPLSPESYTVIDFIDAGDDVAWVKEQGANFVQQKVTQENYADVFSEYVGQGDLIIDLAWNLETASLLEWCHDNGVRYVNASVEVWDPYAGFGGKERPQDRTLYARQMQLREMFDSWGGNTGPTAVLDHGANPGLVSHFVKHALDQMSDKWLAEINEPAERRDAIVAAKAAREYNKLAHLLNVQTIHISERDTQIADVPKRENEFVNTWSVEGFYEEGVAPAEMGWGTHERTLPIGALQHDEGPKNQICLSRPGCRTWVRSWVPCGEILGMVIRHGEAFSISEHLSVADESGEVVYRPTVHYAYCPTDAAIASLHELAMRQYDLQTDQRIMNDEIITGRDELGVLLMGHDFNSWWTGSLLDIHEARQLVPGQNATTLQVAAGILGAVLYTLEEPSKGVLLPDELPHEFVLEAAKPYLGPIFSEAVDWTPLKNRVDVFGSFGGGRPADEDVWQFNTFLVD